MTPNTPNPKELVSQLPKRYGYTNKISQLLHQKGIFVTQSAIYHVIKGNTYNPDILTALMDVVEAYKATQVQLSERFKSIQGF